ncbi:superoxide dismutase [Terribacillus saccharophilus]|uniref:superoxide dismutase n=1 Tax=Terribacillus saccharophilus TaxID=361277 RepID=UPI00201617CD|nr:superoxide dismutase [Terribacillus saccharophilus]
MNNRNYLEALLEWSKAMQEHAGEASIEEWEPDLRELQHNLQQTLLSADSIAQEAVLQLRQDAERLAARAEQASRQNRVQWGQHRLPPLPYRFDALEPHISREIMELHYTKHHQSYVDGLNKAEEMLYVNRGNKTSSDYKHYLREQSFHGSGHFLHTIFWYNMSPNGGGEPSGQLAQQIRKDFGSFQRFKDMFSKAADSVEGVGWAILVWEPRSQHLAIQTLEKHQLFSLADTIPLLVLDMWEHAYYLQYKTEKKQYVENWWNVVNWANVTQRFQTAKQVNWAPF